MKPIPRLLLPILTILLSASGVAPAHAFDGNGGNVHGDAGASGFLVSGFVQANGSGESGVDEAAAESGHWESQPMCSFGGSATCLETLKCRDGTPMTQWLLIGDGGRLLDSYYYCPETGQLLSLR